MNEPGSPSPLPPSSLQPSEPGASAPVPQPRGPMSFGQALDRVFHLMRANFGLFVGTAIVPALVCVVLYVPLVAAMIWTVKPWHPQGQPQASPLTMGWLGAAIFVVAMLMVVIFALYQPAGSFAALEADKGTRVTVGAAWAVAWGKAGRYIWLMILRTLIVMLPIVIFGALLVGGMALTGVVGHDHGDPKRWLAMLPIIMLLYLGSIVYAILIMLRLALAVPACVAENASAWTSIRRSNKLTHGAKGRIFLLALVMYAIVYAAFLVFELAMALLAALGLLVGVLLHLTLAPWGFIGIGVLGIVFLCALLLYMACVWAAYNTVFAVIYHDQRLCMEGVAPAPAG
jgi:hypothetical protein